MCTVRTFPPKHLLPSRSFPFHRFLFRTLYYTLSFQPIFYFSTFTIRYSFYLFYHKQNYNPIDFNFHNFQKSFMCPNQNTELQLLLNELDLGLYPLSNDHKIVIFVLHLKLSLWKINTIWQTGEGGVHRERGRKFLVFAQLTPQGSKFVQLFCHILTKQN